MKIEIPDKLIDETEIVVVIKCKECKKLTIAAIDFDSDYYNKSEDFQNAELHICSCVSGGIYSVYFECPHCNQHIDIY